MFLLCDNNEGKIFNICETTAKTLGLKWEYLLPNSSYIDQELKIG